MSGLGGELERITPAELEGLLGRGEKVAVLDVRRRAGGITVATCAAS